MHTLLPRTAAAPRCVVVVGARQLCRKRRFDQHLLGRHRDGFEACANGRKRGVVTGDIVAYRHNEPTDVERATSSSSADTQHRRTVEALSELLQGDKCHTDILHLPCVEASLAQHMEVKQASRDQDMKKRQHAGMKGMLDMLFDQQEGQHPHAPTEHGVAAASHGEVSQRHQRHTMTQRQDNHQIHSYMAQQHGATSTPATEAGPEACPTANRLITMMRKQGTSTASLLQFVLHYSEQLGTKHCVLAWKLAANFSPQCDSSGSSSSSSSSTLRSSATDPAEAAARSQLVQILTHRLGCSMHELEPRQVAILLWSMGSMQLQQCEAALLPALLNHVQPMLGELQPSELSSVLWACAKLGVCDTGFLDACEGAATRTLSNLAMAAAPQIKSSGGNNRQYLELMTENQQLCNIAWSLAVLNRYNAALFQALCSIYNQRLNTLQSSMLANVLWALTKVRHYNLDFMQRAVSQVATQLHTLAPNHLILIISALVEMVRRERDATQAGAAAGASGQESYISNGPVGVSKILALAHRSLQLAVAELEWKVLCRRNRQVCALEAFSATQVLDVMQAVLMLNEHDPASGRPSSSSSSRPAAAVVRAKDRLGYINTEWQRQQQQWQLQWQHELQDTQGCSFERHFCPVVLATYDDVLLLRLLLDRALTLLPDFMPAQLLQVLSVGARVGFINKRLLAESVRALHAVKPSFSAEELRVLAWALGSLGHRDQELVAG